MSFFSKEQGERTISYLKERFEDIKKFAPYVEFLGISGNYFIFPQHFLSFRSLRNQAWKFAVWADYDKDKNVCGCTYIGEAIALIDKFKPSRTKISTNDFDEFKKEFLLVHEYPYQSFVASYVDIPLDFPAFSEIIFGDGEKYYEGYQCVYDPETESYIQDKTIDKKDFIQKNFRDYWASKRKKQQAWQRYYYLMLKEIPEKFFELPYVSAVGFVDHNWKSGWTTHPQFDVLVSVSISRARKLLKSNSDNDLFVEFDKILDEWNKKLDLFGKEFDDYEYSNFYLSKFDRFGYSVDFISRAGARYKFYKNNSLKGVRYKRKVQLNKILKGRAK